MDEEDELQLQAALAACHSDETSASHATVEAENLHLEVLYQDGATPLFCALEDTQWAQALELIDEVPSEVSTWVKSTGTTKETTFGWSVWRRLPIHEVRLYIERERRLSLHCIVCVCVCLFRLSLERKACFLFCFFSGRCSASKIFRRRLSFLQACRRQPPAWLVAALLRVNPKSANETTQFGQLPLHLAVETGASPEVVNLLIVANWRGILKQDNSGRTPLEVLSHGTLVEDDYQVVQESLQRCLASYEDYDQEWQVRLRTKEDQHAAQLQSLEQQHALKLRTEVDKQSKLETAVQHAKDCAVAAYQERDAWSQKVDATQSKHDSLETEMDRRHAVFLETRRVLQTRENDLEMLQKLCLEKDYERQRLEERLEQLETDLQNVYTLHETQVNAALSQAQRDLHRVWQSQQVLQGQLSGQTQGLELLLKQRGIDVPETQPPTAKPSSSPPRVQRQPGETTSEKEVLEKAKLAAKAALDASSG